MSSPDDNIREQEALPGGCFFFLRQRRLINSGIRWWTPSVGYVACSLQLRKRTHRTRMTSSAVNNRKPQRKSKLFQRHFFKRSTEKCSQLKRDRWTYSKPGPMCCNRRSAAYVFFEHNTFGETCVGFRRFAKFFFCPSF
jgi:hypothetical protein